MKDLVILYADVTPIWIRFYFIFRNVYERKKMFCTSDQMTRNENEKSPTNEMSVPLKLCLFSFDWNISCIEK